MMMAMMTTIPTLGQTSGSNSPYSRYGWGTLADPATGFNKGMAGVAQGERDPSIINVQNPAALSEIDSVTLLFDIGMSLQNCYLQTGGKSLNVQNSSLDYVNAAFRLARRLGFAIGMSPYSYVGYSFSSSSDLDDIDGYGAGTTTSSYEGDGGFRQIYAALGWKVFKPFSVGVKINYIWGDYDHTSTVSYSDSNVKSLTRHYKATINAPSFEFGFQYEQRITDKDLLTVGATMGLGHKIDQRATFINSQSGSSTSASADTVRVTDAFELPNTITAGLSWNHANQWTFAADYTYEAWGKCRFPTLTGSGTDATYAVTKNSLRNRHKVAAGVEFIPKPNGLRVRDHICYRAGVSYSTPYTKINSYDGPHTYLVTCGVALPIVNRYSVRSVINIAAQWEHSEATKIKGIKEDYIRLCVGLTFNANWFSRWKVE